MPIRFHPVSRSKQIEEFTQQPMPLTLPALFLVTALLYAAVGFGGGSTYNALLVLYGADFRVLPAVALICNIIVVTGGVFRFYRAGHVNLKRLAPFMIASVPAAFVGGRLPISETLFVGLLGFALLLSGARLLSGPAEATQPSTHQTVPWLAAASVGGGIGLLSGLVGIGGGIFLAPALYLWRWGGPRVIAAAASVFILVNSLSGLAGQLAKLGDASLLPALVAYWPLFPAVLIGGQIGSALASARLPAGLIKRLTAVLILYVAVRLLYRWVQLSGWL